MTDKTYTGYFSKIKSAASGDTDGRVPVTSSRYAIKTLKLPVETAWQPWYSNSEVIWSFLPFDKSKTVTFYAYFIH